MTFLEKIRKLPQVKKTRLTWAVAGLAAALLVALWAGTSKLRQNLPKDTSLFTTVSRGLKDINASRQK